MIEITNVVPVHANVDNLLLFLTLSFEYFEIFCLFIKHEFVKPLISTYLFYIREYPCHTHCIALNEIITYRLYRYTCHIDVLGENDYRYIHDISL